MIELLMSEEAGEGAAGAAAISDGPADSGRSQPTPGEGGTDTSTDEDAATSGTPEDQADGSGSGDDGDADTDQDAKRQDRRNSFQKRISEKTQQAREANERAEAAERRARAAEEALIAAQRGPDGSPLPGDGLGDFPTLEAYDYDQAAYQRAVIEYNANLTQRSIDSALARQARTRAVEAQREAQQAIVDTFKERSAAFAEEGHQDYYTKVANAGFANHVTQGCVLSDNGPALAYHIASSPELLAELNSLPAPMAMMRLGLISAKLSSPVAPRQTNAPAPANPPTGTRGGKVSKDPEKMSPLEYAKHRGYR